MIIGIVGSRRRNTSKDCDIVKAKFDEIYQVGDTIVSGHCPKGADMFAELIALQRKIPIKLHKAKWDLRGRSAGFYRNTFIAQDADILIACIAEDRTGGTEDTIKKYLNLGKDKLYLV